MRFAALSVGALVLAAGGFAANAPPAPRSTFSCDTTIGQYDPRDVPDYRMLFARIAVPPRSTGQPDRIDAPNAFPRGLPYWLKAGLLVRARTRAEITVPTAWRGRVAVTWGNSAVTSSLRVPACRGGADVWHVYPGGFYVARPSCVPLRIRIGTRSMLVWFGVGRACSAR